MAKRRSPRSGVTSEKYEGIPIHAAKGLHEVVMTKITQTFDKSASILELAAGAGALTQRLLDHGFTVEPVDLTADGWRVVSTDVVVTDFNRPDWCSSLSEKEYSQIIAVEVIEHLDNPRQFLRQLHSLMKPGGRLIVTTPNPLSAMSVALALTQQRYYVFDSASYYAFGHVTIIPSWMLNCHAEDAGFKTVELTSVCEPEFDAWWKNVVHSVWRRIVNICRRDSEMGKQIVFAVFEK